MECASCGLDNDPSATYCARCNTLLLAPPPASAPTIYIGPPARSFPLLPALIAVAVVLLFGVIGIGVLLVRDRDREPIPPAAQPGPTAVVEATTAPTPAPGPTTTTQSPQEEAQVVDQVLDQSTASRAKLNQAIDRVNRCTQLGAALADMRAVGDERGRQIATVDAADLSAIDSGSLRSSLRSALQAALQADEEFVAWAAPTVSGGCGDTAARTAAWERGQTYSKQAQTAKKRFVALWNPIAASLGRPQRSTQKI
ncbi:zinc finger Ran-binding domain-containing protein [Actinoplanes regularis]|uniref:Zinc-ribbon domain-containing protein n=1 Tax=Actinoplanes regularis TaxID=52697 RepID=A0A239F7J8_9ACTN|nr:zinc finger Ran-binding domain-containing protein [Actinoplanes regularis]GIE90010.1 hypothetical protein Are01nite_64900 [Actinoplanes regularis]SNS52731.1 hypothetical protein SAMN06264365_117121 [Actinoplanes regularis]